MKKKIMITALLFGGSVILSQGLLAVGKFKEEERLRNLQEWVYQQPDEWQARLLKITRLRPRDVRSHLLTLMVENPGNFINTIYQLLPDCNDDNSDTQSSLCELMDEVFIHASENCSDEYCMPMDMETKQFAARYLHSNKIGSSTIIKVIKSMESAGGSHAKAVETMKLLRKDESMTCPKARAIALLIPATNDELCVGHFKWMYAGILFYLVTQEYCEKLCGEWCENKNVEQSTEQCTYACEDKVFWSEEAKYLSSLGSDLIVSSLKERTGRDYQYQKRIGELKMLLDAYAMYSHNLGMHFGLPDLN